MFAVIFCTVYEAFPIFSSVNIIFVYAYKFFSFCYGATYLIFCFLRKCCSRLISGFLSIYHSFSPVLLILIPFFCQWGSIPIKLFSFLLAFGFSSMHLCIIAIFPFHTRANWYTLTISSLNLVSDGVILFCWAIFLNLLHE